MIRLIAVLSVLAVAGVMDAAPAPLPRAERLWYEPSPWPVGVWVKPLTYAEGECRLVLRADGRFTEEYPTGRYEGTWRVVGSGSVMLYGRETYGNDAPCRLLTRLGGKLKPSWGETNFRRVR